MKKLILITFLFVSCGGTLTDEQRKKMHDGMKRNEIKRITEARITEAAFLLGRTLAGMSETQIDSLKKAGNFKIVQLRTGDKKLSGVESEVFEAYVSGTAAGVDTGDNIQKLGTDTLLYTKPILKELPDGSHQLNYALGIKMPRREVVKTIKD